MKSEVSRRILVYGGLLVFVAFLAAISIPAYQDYTLRAQVSEGRSISAAAKASVLEFHLKHGRPPANNNEAGFHAAERELSGHYTESVEIVYGRIDISFGNNANRYLVGLTLSITPYIRDESILWRCGTAPHPGEKSYTVLDPERGNYRPGSAARFPHYLPSGCRS